MPNLKDYATWADCWCGWECYGSRAFVEPLYAEHVEACPQAKHSAITTRGRT